MDDRTAEDDAGDMPREEEPAAVPCPAYTPTMRGKPGTCDQCGHTEADHNGGGDDAA